MAISLVKNYTLNVGFRLEHIPNSVQFTPMEYAFYIILGTLTACGILYVLWRLLERASKPEFSFPADTAASPPLDDTVDDFMCIMRSDGSTITSANGVTVIVGR